MLDCCRTAGNMVHINVKAQPGASKNEITGVRDGRLCVRIAAAPEDGKANAELSAFLAKTLGCPKREIVLLHGEKSRLKTIALPFEYALQLEKILEEIP